MWIALAFLIFRPFESWWYSASFQTNFEACTEERTGVASNFLTQFCEISRKSEKSQAGTSGAEKSGGAPGVSVQAAVKVNVPRCQTELAVGDELSRKRFQST